MTKPHMKINIKNQYINYKRLQSLPRNEYVALFRHFPALRRVRQVSNHPRSISDTSHAAHAQRAATLTKIITKNKSHKNNRQNDGARAPLKCFVRPKFDKKQKWRNQSTACRKHAKPTARRTASDHNRGSARKKVRHRWFFNMESVDRCPFSFWRLFITRILYVLYHIMCFMFE